MRGIKRYKHPKTGIVYCYHRASGKRLEAEFGTPEFFTELAAAEAGHVPAQKQPHYQAGTLGRALADYRGSARFRDLALATRREYDRYINALVSSEGMPLTEITPSFIARLRDSYGEAHGWRSANYLLSVLSVVLKLAAEYGHINTNPAAGIVKLKRPKGLAKSNRPWTQEEQETVINAAPPHLRLVLALGRYTSLRLTDVVKLRRTAVQNGWIVLETSKTDYRAELPIRGRLAAELARAPKHDAITICANSDGRPWTRDGFESSWRTFRLRLEADGIVAPGLTFHGFRHTRGKALAEAGASEEEIAAWLTHVNPAMARHYSKEASRRVRVSGAVTRMKERKR